MSKVYSYSYNQERYWGEYGSREEALAAGRHENPDYTCFWTGVNVSAPLKSLMPDATWVIEFMQEQAYDICGEAAEDFVDGLSKEKCSELTQRIHSVIEAWLTENNELPRFWTVEETQEHPAEDKP